MAMDDKQDSTPDASIAQLPFQVEFLSGYNRIKFHPAVPITLEIMTDVLTAERASPERQPINDLLDARGCTVDASLNNRTVNGIVELISSDPPKYMSHRKTAFLVDSAVVFGMTRMFQLIGSNLPYEVEIFKDENEAIDWVTKE